MSVFTGATNTTINNGNFTAVSTTVAAIGTRSDIVRLLHSHSALSGVLDAKERFDAPKCNKGTRTSMILGMKKFVQEGDVASSPALYWLHGPAGVGKSALAQSLALLLQEEGDHAASFFFSRTSPGRSNGNQLIVTLAYQLAINFPALQPFMLKVVNTNPGILSASNAVQMQRLIINPINKWRKKYTWSIRRLTDRLKNVDPHPRLILVDGLDECSGTDVQTDLILCIASAVRQLSIPIRFVIASRPESHILATFELNPAFQCLNGVAVTKTNLGDDEDADEQIATFLLKEFAEIRRTHPIRSFLPQAWPHPDQIKQLVSKSSKGFIYPATVIRYIKMPRNRPDECLARILGLSEIPTTDKPYELLDSLYRHIFESLPAANKACVHDIFHFLVLPSRWASVNLCTTIEQHFGYPPGHVQHILGDLLCLVEFANNGHVKILHASLPDFLLDQSRSGPLFIDVDDAHTTVAASYLMWSRDIWGIPDRYPFSEFLDHLQASNMSNTLLNDQIVQTDLLRRYKQIRFAIAERLRLETLGDSDETKPGDRLYSTEIECIAFMIAFLLILVIRDGPHNYIRTQIAAITRYISTDALPWFAHELRFAKIIRFMSPLFRTWKSTVYHECINRIFECSVDSSHHELRETIFELYFLMTASLHRESMLSPADMRHMPRITVDQYPDSWTNIIVGLDAPDDQ